MVAAIISMCKTRRNRPSQGITGRKGTAIAYKQLEKQETDEWRRY